MSKKTDYREFSDPQLAAIYDTLNPLGDDSAFFLKQAEALSARRVVDLGCGTGLLTVELARRGHLITGIEPSESMLNIARSKLDARKVNWIRGSFEQMQGLQSDLVLMTSHVAQFFLEEEAWRELLETSCKALVKGGYLVFDIRRLTDPPFIGWPIEKKPRRVDNTSVGPIDWYFNLIGIENSRVQYELHYLFVSSGEKFISVNELKFRSQPEIEESLINAGFQVEAIYGDWNFCPVSSHSPEMIFVARRR